MNSMAILASLLPPTPVLLQTAVDLLVLLLLPLVFSSAHPLDHQKCSGTHLLTWTLHSHRHHQFQTSQEALIPVHICLSASLFCQKLFRVYHRACRRTAIDTSPLFPTTCPFSVAVLISLAFMIDPLVPVIPGLYSQLILFVFHRV